jgi:hypothetical protein
MQRQLFESSGGLFPFVKWIPAIGFTDISCVSVASSSEAEMSFQPSISSSQPTTEICPSTTEGQRFTNRGHGLLADAELAEDEVDDVIARCGAAESVESAKRFVEIKKNHFVRDVRGCSLTRSMEGSCRVRY